MTALEPFFLAEFLGTATWLWLVFISIVIGLLVFDLGVLHREQREIGVTESLLAISRLACCSASGSGKSRAETPGWISTPAF
jgi:hypothetical protein